MPRPGVFIVSAKRTPFGSFCGKLKNHTATDMAVVAAQAALKSASVRPEDIDHVIFGNVLQSSKDAAYLTRHVGLRIGLPQSTPAFTLNRLCGSGFQSIIEAAQQILVGDTHVAIAGGTESMTQVPYVTRGARLGFPLGVPVENEDFLWTSLTDQLIQLPMGMTAEKLGELYGVTREECDEFADKSQTRYRLGLFLALRQTTTNPILAKNAGYFDAEIEPITLKTKKGEELYSLDEHPRETNMESLAKLSPVFKKNGLVTPGNASGVSDGAAAVVVASESAVTKLHLQPLARVVGWHAVGCDPSIMGIGPVDAIRGVCKKTNVPLEKIEAVDVNEAFAAQCLAVQKELKIESDRLNLNGGAIALGHPLGSSGARIAGHLAHEIQRRGITYALGAACIGGGQGIAVLLQKV
jgi:acetyl-CoA acyltransferase 2